MKKLKDFITNVCGLVVGVGGAVLASGLEIGEEPKLIIGLSVAVAGALIGWFTGKEPKNG